MNDYQKISQSINYLVEHAQEQPSLKLLADKAGLSPSHFQKKFTAWTGVSPKSFLQYLTLQHAKEMLEKGKPVQEAAWTTGLSGPGRLHDLCVSLEAASLGEIKSGGAGLNIRYGYGPTPFGECLLAESQRGICYLAFTQLRAQETELNNLKQLWPSASIICAGDTAPRMIQRIFNFQNESDRLPLHAYVKGTKFQLRVWRALLEIPEGSLTSYGKIAKAVRHPGAARAVGSAVGANPLAYVIPCHRVIGNSGLIGNYRWDSSRKQIMLACEYARNSTIR